METFDDLEFEWLGLGPVEADTWQDNSWGNAYDAAQAKYAALHPSGAPWYGIGPAPQLKN